jgi:hypothetical protein
MTKAKFLGIIVTPANVQTEGLEVVMDNIANCGANAIALDPWLLQPTSPEEGSRIPDLHIDGHKRLFGRPLWGKRELHVESFLAFEPEEALYLKSAYEPMKKAVPASIDRTIPQQLIESAHERGMKAHLGLAPFLPPGVREEDRPVRVDGRPLQPPFIAHNGCLNNPDIRAYALAAIRDLICHYPYIDGLILDWAEFGAYQLQEHFTCFCPACEKKAKALGYDWAAIRRDVMALWESLHHITSKQLAHSRRIMTNPSELLAALAAYPGILTFLRFKSDCVVSFYQDVRKLLDRLGLEDLDLSARGWISPWNRSSGMDYRRLGGICTAVLPKIFTFDHAVLPRWLGQTLQEWNPDLPESPILEAVKSWLNLPDDIERPTFADYNIPAPDDPHPAHLSSYQVRLEETAAQVSGTASLYPIAHPYLPDDQWRQMVGLIRDSPADGMWVNFYSYLTDQKFDIMRQEWQKS